MPMNHGAHVLTLPGCSYGTTIEQFAKLGDSIYFRSVPSKSDPVSNL